MLDKREVPIYAAHLLTGFPWYYLGHSQFRFLTLIQVADVTSALGISFLVALVNAWLVDLLSLPLLRRTFSTFSPASSSPDIGAQLTRLLPSILH